MSKNKTAFVMPDRPHGLDSIRKSQIEDSLKVIRQATKEMELLHKHNFEGLYDVHGRGPDPSSGNIPAKERLLDVGHRIVKAGADILRYAADLSDE